MSLHSHPKIEWVKLSCLSSLFALSVPTLNSVSCDIDTDAADVLLPDAYEKEEDDNDDDEESRTETEDEDDEDETLSIPAFPPLVPSALINKRNVKRDIRTKLPC